MAKTIRDLLVRVGVKADSTQLTSLDKQLASTTKTARRLGVAMAAVGAAIGAGAVHFAKAGAEAEKSQVAFETMTGSVEKAAEIMREMEGLALETPFTFQEVEKNTKLLKAMGIESESLFGTMRILGDVAAGLNVPLERIALNFGQVRAQGKLTGREMRDFVTAGVPLRDMLAKNLGVPIAQISDMMAKGQISFEDTRKAFENMAGPGGQFNNLMAKMSKTMGGVVSNLGVMWTLLSRDIGKEINRDLAPVINELFEFLKENRAVIARKIASAIKGIVGAIKEAAKFAWQFRKAFMFIAGMGFLALLGKMAVALSTLGKALVLVGNTGLIAWLKMTAPLIVLGAAVAAAVVAFQDLWTAIFHPEADSVTKYWLNQLGIWEDFQKAIENVKKTYEDFKNIFFGEEDPEKDPMKRGLGFKARKGVFGEMKEDVAGLFQTVKGLFTTQQQQPVFGSFESVAQGRYGVGYQGQMAGTISTPVTVNIGGTNATPAQIQGATRDGVKEALRNVSQGVK